MKKFFSVVSNVRVNQLLCCSGAVLLTACGGGAADIDNGQQAPAAALSHAGATGQSRAAVPSSGGSSAAMTFPSSTVDASGAGAGRPPGVLATSTAVAATSDLYVAADGSDSNPGTQAAPFLTIARADSRASAGYTIHVAPGTYEVSAPNANSIGIKTTRSGTPSAHIKFVSDVKGAAKIVVSGTGTAWHAKGSYVDIDGFDISGSGRHGILAGGSNLIISNNFIHDLTISGGCNGGGGAGIDTYGPAGKVVINANVVRNIGYSMIGSCSTVHGIYVANPNTIVTNNIVSGAAAVGINQWHGATAGTIVNNTTFHNKIGILLGQGDGGATPAGSQNNYVANNIVYDNKTYGIVEGGKMGGNNRYVNNLVASSGTDLRVKGAVSGSISADPLFVNYQANGSGDYRVYSSSPAIDRGTAVEPPTTDIVGVARPRDAAIDIGAYEF